MSYVTPNSVKIIKYMHLKFVVVVVVLRVGYDSQLPYEGGKIMAWRRRNHVLFQNFVTGFKNVQMLL